MGIIARVLVSFTTVAMVRVLDWWMASQEDAAAVTDEVSLMAVPAKRPKPWLDRPIH